MKVAYFSRSIIPSQFANSVHVMRMCNALASLGHDVTLFAPNRTQDMLPEEPFAFYGIPPSFSLRYVPWVNFKGRSYFYSLASTIAAKRLGIELAIGRDIISCFFSALAGIPIAFETHFPNELRHPLERIIFSRMKQLDRFRSLVVITQPLKEHYVTEQGIPDSKILVAADAADEPRKLPNSWHRNGDGLNIGYVGQLYPGRGVELIVELAARCSWATFHLIGGPDEVAGTWRDKCREQDNLIFHGFKHPAEAEALRQSFDVVLAPYQRSVRLSDGGIDTTQWMSPIKIFEYMASAKPMVASDLPILHEVLDDGRNALLCPPDDIDAWTAALARLREDEGLRNNLADCAHEDFRRSYTWRARAEKIVAFSEPNASG